MFSGRYRYGCDSDAYKMEANYLELYNAAIERKRRIRRELAREYEFEQREREFARQRESERKRKESEKGMKEMARFFLAYDQACERGSRPPPCEEKGDIVVEPGSCDTIIKEKKISEELNCDIEDRANTNSAGVIEQLKEVHATYIYFDPFLLHCSPSDFVIVDLYSVELKMYKRMITALFTSLLLLVEISVVAILQIKWPRLVFDPGKFEDESFRREGE